jgi:hypothetical protein
VPPWPLTKAQAVYQGFSFGYVRHGWRSPSSKH